VAGELTMAGSTRPVTARLSISAEGGVSGTISLTQSNWGIKPYRGMMGALKVRDEVTILIDARLGAG
jgi:polyisoprenoid-binding protein YceI